MHQAQDTFMAEIDGAPVLVQKGSVWASNHAVVKLDADRGLLFKMLESDDDAPPKRGRGRPRKNPFPAEVPADDGNGDGGDEQ